MGHLDGQLGHEEILKGYESVGAAERKSDGQIPFPQNQPANRRFVNIFFQPTSQRPYIRNPAHSYYKHPPKHRPGHAYKPASTVHQQQTAYHLPTKHPRPHHPHKVKHQTNFYTQQVPHNHPTSHHQPTSYHPPTSHHQTTSYHQPTSHHQPTAYSEPVSYQGQTSHYQTTPQHTSYQPPQHPSVYDSKPSTAYNIALPTHTSSPGFVPIYSSCEYCVPVTNSHTFETVSSHVSTPQYVPTVAPEYNPTVAQEYVPTPAPEYVPTLAPEYVPVYTGTQDYIPSVEHSAAIEPVYSGPPVYIPKSTASYPKLLDSVSTFSKIQQGSHDISIDDAPTNTETEEVSQEPEEVDAINPVDVVDLRISNITDTPQDLGQLAELPQDPEENSNIAREPKKIKDAPVEENIIPSVNVEKTDLNSEDTSFLITTPGEVATEIIVINDYDIADDALIDTHSELLDDRTEHALEVPEATSEPNEGDIATTTEIVINEETEQVDAAIGQTETNAVDITTTEAILEEILELSNTNADTTFTPETSTEDITEDSAANDKSNTDDPEEPESTTTRAEVPKDTTELESTTVLSDNATTEN